MNPGAKANRGERDPPLGPRGSAHNTIQDSLNRYTPPSQLGSGNGYQYGQQPSSLLQGFGGSSTLYPHSNSNSHHHYSQGEADPHANAKTSRNSATMNNTDFTHQHGMSTTIVEGLPFVETNSNAHMNINSNSVQSPMNMDSATSRAMSTSFMEDTTTMDDDDCSINTRMSMSLQQQKHHPAYHHPHGHAWNSGQDGGPTASSASDIFRGPHLEPILSPGRTSLTSAATTGNTYTTSHNGDVVAHEEAMDTNGNKQNQHHHLNPQATISIDSSSTSHAEAGTAAGAGGPPNHAAAVAPSHSTPPTATPAGAPAPHVPAHAPYSHMYPHPHPPIGVPPPVPGTHPHAHYPYYGYPYYGPPPPHPHAHVPPPVPPPQGGSEGDKGTASSAILKVESVESSPESKAPAPAPATATTTGSNTSANAAVPGTAPTPPAHAVYPHWPYPYHHPHHPPPYGVSMGLGHFYPPPPPPPHYYPGPPGHAHAPPGPYGHGHAGGEATTDASKTQAPSSPGQEALPSPSLPINKNLLSPKQPPMKKRKSITRKVRSSSNMSTRSSTAPNLSPSIEEKDENEDGEEVNLVVDTSMNDEDEVQVVENNSNGSSTTNPFQEIKRTGSSIITDAAASLSLNSSMDAGDVGPSTRNSGYSSYTGYGLRAPRLRTSSEGSWKPSKSSNTRHLGTDQGVKMNTIDSSTSSPAKRSNPAPIPIPPSAKKVASDSSVSGRTGRARSPGRPRILTSSPLELERKTTLTTSNTSSTRSISTTSTAASESVSAAASAPVPIARIPRARSRSKSAASTASSRRDRKNALSRRRAARLKEEINEIKTRPVHERTVEEVAKLEAYEERRLRKNQISRERALEKKSRFEKISSKDIKEWTEEEKKFIQETSKAKLRKNEGDRARRRRMKKDNEERSLTGSHAGSIYGSFDDGISTGLSNSISGSRSWGGDDYSTYDGGDGGRPGSSSNAVFPTMTGVGGSSFGSAPHHPALANYYSTHPDHHNPETPYHLPHAPMQQHGLEQDGGDRSFQRMSHEQGGLVEPLPLHGIQKPDAQQDYDQGNAMNVSDNSKNYTGAFHPRNSSDQFSSRPQQDVFNPSGMLEGAILSPKINDIAQNVDPIPHHYAFQDKPHRGVHHYTQSPTMELCAGSSILDASLNEIAFSPSSRTVGTSNAASAFSHHNADHPEHMSAAPELSHMNSPLKLPPLNLPRRPTRSMDDSQSFYDTIPPETKGIGTSASENFGERQYSSSQKNGTGRQHGDAIAVSFSVDTV